MIRYRYTPVEYNGENGVTAKGAVLRIFDESNVMMDHDVLIDAFEKDLENVWAVTSRERAALAGLLRALCGRFKALRDV